MLVGRFPWGPCYRLGQDRMTSSLRYQILNLLAPYHVSLSSSLFSYTHTCINTSYTIFSDVPLWPLQTSSSLILVLPNNILQFTTLNNPFYFLFLFFLYLFIFFPIQHSTHFHLSSYFVLLRGQQNSTVLNSKLSTKVTLSYLSIKNKFKKNKIQQKRAF